MRKLIAALAIVAAGSGVYWGHAVGASTPGPNPNIAPDGSVIPHDGYLHMQVRYKGALRSILVRPDSDTIVNGHETMTVSNQGVQRGLEEAGIH